MRRTAEQLRPDDPAQAAWNVRCQPTVVEDRDGLRQMMPNAIAISHAPTPPGIKPPHSGAESNQLLQGGSQVSARPYQVEMLKLPNIRWGSMTFTSWQFGVFVASCSGPITCRRFGISRCAAGACEPVLLRISASLNCCRCWRRGSRHLSLPGPRASGTARRGCRSASSSTSLLLAFFKYKFLFIDPAFSAVDFAPIDFLLRLPLPIGISFFVFHNISLLVDLTRQKAAAPKLAGRFPLHHLLSAARLRPDHARRECSCRRSSRNARRCRLRRGSQMDHRGLLLQALCRQ